MARPPKPPRDASVPATARRGRSLEQVQALVLEHLARAGEHGLTKAELVAGIGRTSWPSMQRALKQLREEAGAPIERFGPAPRWRLSRPFSLSLAAPQADDVVAALLAKALVESFADADLVDRIQRLAADLDQRACATSGVPRAEIPRTGLLSSTLSLGTTTKPGVLRALLLACGRACVRVRYDSPWREPDGDGRWYELEPWAVRIHDGAAYLRAWRRDGGGARTFRVAQIDEVEPLPATPSEPLPGADARWGESPPAFGIDVDRPGTACIVMQGSLARWVARVQWHPEQHDEWLIPGQRLRRQVAYRSCRELARRLISVADGIESIEPLELATEVRRIAAAAMREPSRIDALPPVLHRVRASAVPRRPGESRATTARARAKPRARRRPTSEA
ncbi:MAG: WYL domain-containing protein [Nannocystaceae bacterium]|nr:WYL domain-containing protein [Deltaproteobacteria bacterium]MBP7292000.1 WYL domain-containing protein [Nannocystaceae bacterium]